MRTHRPRLHGAATSPSAFGQLGAGGAAVLLLLLAGGCESHEKPSDSGGPSDAALDDRGFGPGGHRELHLRQLDLWRECIDMGLPEPRSHALLTPFILDDPVRLGPDPGGPDLVTMTYSTSRGILLVGGIAHDDGALLNDVWLLDLTNVATAPLTRNGLTPRPDDAVGICPWVKLSDSAVDTGGGIAAGGLVWDAPRRQFVMFGGLAGTGDSRWARSGIFQMPVDRWQTHEPNQFDAVADLPAIDYHFLRNGSPRCDDTEFPIGDLTGALFPLCGPSWFYEDVDPCEINPEYEVEGGSWLCNYTVRRPCASDPRCRDADFWDPSASAAVLPQAAAGLAHFATVHDPMSDTVAMHGGTTGCTAAGCAGWVELYRDGALADGLERANSEHVLTLDLATLAVTVEAFHGDAIAPPGWPEPIDHSVSHVQGALWGLEWDLEERAWTAVRPDMAWVLAGGTRYQSLPMEIDYSVSDKRRNPWYTMILDEYGEADAEAEWGWLPWDFWAAEDVPVGIDTYYDDRAISPDGLVLGPNASILHVTEAGGAEHFGPDSSVRTGRRDVGLARMGPHTALVAGGIDSAGMASAELYVLDANDRVVYEAGDSLGGPRSGAAAATDPVSGVTYLFGGDDSSRLELIWEGEITADDGEWAEPEWTAVEIEYDPSAEEWTIRGALETTWDCESPRCYGETIEFEFPEHIYNDLTFADGTLSVTFLDDDTTLPIGNIQHNSWLYGTDPPKELHHATFAIPRYVVSGERIRVTLEATLEEWPLEGGEMDHRRLAYGSINRYLYGDSGVDPACAEETGFEYIGVPIRMRDAEGRRSTGRVLSAVEAPPEYVPITPGIHLESCFGHDARWPWDDGPGVRPGPDAARCSDFGAPEHMPMRYSVPMLPSSPSRGFELERETMLPSFTEVRLWMDQCIADEVREEFLAYADAGLLNDLDWIEAHLGPIPHETLDLIIERPNKLRTTYRGMASYSKVRIIPAVAADGERRSALLYDGFDRPVYSVVVHELVHEWMNVRQYNKGLGWLTEGLPTLLATARHPTEAPGDERLLRGLNHAMDWTNKAAARDELDEHQSLLVSEEVRVRYDMGAYVLAAWAQLYLEAIGASEADVAFRDGLGPLLDPAARFTTVTLAEVEALLNDGMTHDFYHEWIERTDGGFPLLRVTSVADSPAGAVAEIEQVQTHLQTIVAPVPLWSEVPFHLACVDDDDESLAFSWCTADGTRTHAPPFVLAGASGVVDLGHALVDDPWPARVALLDSYHLLPHHVAQYAIQAGEGSPLAHTLKDDAPAPVAPTWQLWCNGEVEGVCSPVPPLSTLDGDADGDGRPARWSEGLDDLGLPHRYLAQGDCVPHDAAVYPGVALPPPCTGWGHDALECPDGDIVDRDCDGWPLEHWVD